MTIKQEQKVSPSLASAQCVNDIGPGSTALRFLSKRCLTAAFHPDLCLAAAAFVYVDSGAVLSFNRNI